MTGDPGTPQGAGPTPSAGSGVPVCAIGASAGGVTALQNLFRQLPDDLGLAYVVIVHLSPDQPSALTEVLSVTTRMPVAQITDSPVLERDRVYVIAPDRELVIAGDSVSSREFSEPRGRRAPIDMFFRSVAGARGDGIAVVLSGAGADGSLGVRAVKEAGGVIMVQEPAEAGFASMPQNAISTGAADFVAPVARLAERIAEVARSKEAVRSLDPDASANELRRIVTFLRARTGHDFSSYKRATVMRRVVRRMQVCRASNLAQYADLLLAVPEEAKELFSDLLISVTMFFRDPAAFEALLAKAIRPLLDARDPAGGEAIRAWVVGCATGEEAYGVAMLLLEEVQRRRLPVEVQVFATDLDEGALATAREARYPRSIEADVSEERLARFFLDEGTHYRVRRELRESVLFASHSVIKDPPFGRLDLVTCRNLLIYLERSMQSQLCSIFHYALKPGGFLFLGSAETADAAPELFATADRDWRIYFARPRVDGGLMPVLPQFAAPEREAAPQHALAGRRDRPEVPAAMHVSALERGAPASALVGASQNVLHLSPNAGRFLQHSAGPISDLLPAVVRPELRLDLRLALSQALEREETTLTHPVPVLFEGGVRRRVAMQVAPMPTDERMGAQALVFFLDGGEWPDDADPAGAPDQRPDEVRRLYAELKSAQETVVASQLGHEALVQDLRATNEELQSINEEHRSTAEELETSKEELQSINEELHTVNAELKSKLSSISIAHSDLQNLTAATEIGTLFLDSQLRIKMFTPPVAELFNVTRADTGRVVMDFTHRLEHDGIERDVRRVLRDLAMVEAEVRSTDGAWYVMRIRPYRTVEDRIDGTVLTFVDVTARRQAEEALSRNETEYRNLFNSIDEGFCVAEVLFDEAGRPFDYRFQVVNAAFEDQTGLRDAVGRTVLEMAPEHEPFWFETFGRIALSGEPERFENRAEALGRWHEGYAFRVGPADRHRVAVLFKDVIARKRVETALRESEARQRALIENVPMLVWRGVDGGEWTWSSPQWEGFTGQSASDSAGRGWLAPIHPDDRALALECWREGERTGRFEAEYRIRDAAAGRYRWFQSRATPVRNDRGETVEWLGMSTDVDDLRSMQERQKVLVAELQHRTRNLLGVVRSLAAQTVRQHDAPEDFFDVFSERLIALSGVQGLLSRSDQEPITLGAVIGRELEALSAGAAIGRVRVEGPEVRLPDEAVQTLALALHELATNARKYGALANETGRLSVTWQTYGEADREGGPGLMLEWRETGLPARPEGPSAPRSGGYGRELIERALPYALGARTSFTLSGTGLLCTIDLPLGAVATSAAQSA